MISNGHANQIQSWWIASLVLHRKDPLSSRTGWLKPFLLYLVITLRFIFFYVPITIVTKPMRMTWHHTGVRFAALVPENMKIPYVFPESFLFF